jgi:hypothetical protein
MSEHEPKVLAGFGALALGWVLLCSCNSPSAVSTNAFPGIPRLPIARLSTQQSGGVTLRWDKGIPPETTVSNLTTGTFIYAGLADAVMFELL